MTGAADLTPRPILDVASELGLDPADVEPYGRDKAKVSLAALERPATGKGRLILVTAINPTPAGEGKTTTSVGLAMGLRRLGRKVALALREPSLGPVFGVKGGGTGGGKASLSPAEDINLHFTGDIHAITTAHNLLSALVDNSLYYAEVYGDKGRLDIRQITWARAMDMNDRFLRDCIVGLGGKANGFAREERFDITAASEVMAILALSTGYADLEERLGRIIVGHTYSGKPVTASELGAPGAMTVLLKDALKPNLVQTAEGGPALVHCGPFGNIAHGCNSVLATRLAMQQGDYAVTEAGFGLDLGGEKFLDIKCRQMGIWPRAAVVVVTLRALKMHGGASVKNASAPDRQRLWAGLEHLQQHLRNVRGFGLPPVVAINVFPSDTEEELALVETAATALGAEAVARSNAFVRGGEGALDLARAVADVVDATDANPPEPRFIYDLAEAPEEKIRRIARTVYGARDVEFTKTAVADLKRVRDLGWEGLPICMAKTQLSLTDDPSVAGSPRDFVITVRSVRVSAGAGFLVPLTGEMMTMPGLPRHPAVRSIRLMPDGTVKGLMQNDG